jgi:hypothetical protein
MALSCQPLSTLLCFWILNMSEKINPFASYTEKILPSRVASIAGVRNPEQVVHPQRHLAGIIAAYLPVAGRVEAGGDHMELVRFNRESLPAYRTGYLEAFKNFGSRKISTAVIEASWDGYVDQMAHLSAHEDMRGQLNTGENGLILGRYDYMRTRRVTNMFPVTLSYMGPFFQAMGVDINELIKYGDVNRMLDRLTLGIDRYSLAKDVVSMKGVLEGEREYPDTYQHTAVVLRGLMDESGIGQSPLDLFANAEAISAKYEQASLQPFETYCVELGDKIGGVMQTFASGAMEWGATTDRYVRSHVQLNDNLKTAYVGAIAGLTLATSDDVDRMIDLGYDASFVGSGVF